MVLHKINPYNFLLIVAIFLYALNIRPITLNLSAADIIVIFLFILSPIRILNHAFIHSVYRDTFFIYFLYLTSLAFVGMYALNIEKHILALAQYGFVFLVLVPVIMRYSKRHFDLVLKAFIFGAILSLTLAFVFYISGVQLLSDWIEYTTTGGIYKRISSGATNDFGFIMAISIMFLYLLYMRRQLGGFYTFFLSSYLFGGIIMSASRSSVVAVIVFFIIIFSHNFNLRQFFKMMILTLITLYLFFIIFEDTNFLLNLERLSFNSSTGSLIGDRLNQYNVGIGLLLENIFGIGMGSYQELNFTAHTIHNILLIIAVEGGLLSLLLFMLFWVLLFIRVYSKTKMGYIAFSIIFSVFLYMQAITHVYDRMFWIPVALMLAFNNLNKIKKSEH